MEDINYVQIDTWQISVIIALLIITMVSMLVLMAYFYLTFIRPSKDTKPTNNDHPVKRRRGRPKKSIVDDTNDLVQVTPTSSSPEYIRQQNDHVRQQNDDRLVKAIKSIPLPQKDDLKKLRDVKLTKPKAPEPWMSDLDISNDDE